MRHASAVEYVYAASGQQATVRAVACLLRIESRCRGKNRVLVERTWASLFTLNTQF